METTIKIQRPNFKWSHNYMMSLFPTLCYSVASLYMFFCHTRHLMGSVIRASHTDKPREHNFIQPSPTGTLGSCAILKSPLPSFFLEGWKSLTLTREHCFVFYLSDTSQERDTNTMGRSLHLFISEKGKQTETHINDISFSGRAVFTDIHWRFTTCDGSQRDCRKRRYLNGMKCNVDAVQRPGEMDCY